MPSFATVANAAVVQAQDVNQLVNALNGAAGLGVPLAVTAVNDSVNFAAAIKNGETTNSRALQVLRANNVVLLQADANGLVASVDGIAAAAQLVNVSLAQTLTNKTLTGPIINSGGLQVTLGNVGIGIAPGTNNAVLISGSITSVGATQTGIADQHTGSSAATTEITSFYAQPGTAAAAFAANIVTGFHALNPSKGAGSTINNAYGLLVDATTAGNTNNYGVNIGAPSGGSGDNFSLVTAGACLLGASPGSAAFTTGHCYLPLVAGTPTGVPADGTVNNRAPIVIDNSGNKIWVRIGGTWKGVTVA